MVDAPANASAAPAWVQRGLLFGAAWVVVSGGAASSWLLGVPSVAFATWASLQLAPPSGMRVSAGGLVRFVGYFLVESLRGGIDVAVRTLAPQPRIRPGIVSYACRLPQGTPTVLFAHCVSLLPGTLSVRLEAQRLQLHLLDRDTDPHAQLQALEDRIAGLILTHTEPRHA